jgi:rhamnosyltransferase
MNYHDILAVVVSFNGLEKTINTVKCLQNKVAHIYIVDNASDRDSRIMLKIYDNNIDITVNYLSENLGIGNALNKGIEKAKELGLSWLLTMDQDSLVNEAMIKLYCSAINQKSDFICLTPNIVYNGINNIMNSGAVEFAITSGNLIKVSVFDEIGYYNEDLLIDCIDFDLSLRIRYAGYDINKIYDAIMIHELGDSKGYHPVLNKFYISHPPVRRYYMFRNHCYLIEKYILKFPWFIIKLTIANLILLLLIPFFDRRPFASLKYIVKGFCDYCKKKKGSISEVYK